MTFLTFLLQADTAAAIDQAAQTVAVKQQASMSLIDMTIKGGWLMIPLFILSILTIYIFGVKWYTIRKASKLNPNFMNDIKDLIHDGKIKSALALCKREDTPVSRLIEKGIERMGRPLTDIQAAVENLGNIEVARLEKGLPGLASIAGGAPMIGFLGTVLGMVQAFFNMSQAGNNIDITLLSGGIYTAMVTTVAGLIVGILAFFGYNYLTAKVSDLVFMLQSNTIEFMDLLHEPGDNTVAK
jgi:biopolymer transport protein ExbB